MTANITKGDLTVELEVVNGLFFIHHIKSRLVSMVVERLKIQLKVWSKTVIETSPHLNHHLEGPKPIFIECVRFPEISWCLCYAQGFDSISEYEVCHMQRTDTYLSKHDSDANFFKILGYNCLVQEELCYKIKRAILSSSKFRSPRAWVISWPTFSKGGLGAHPGTQLTLESVRSKWNYISKTSTQALGRLLKLYPNLHTHHQTEPYT